MAKSACINAERNKEINQINNYKVICAKVEDAIDEAIKPYQGLNYKIVAVVDPPRSGLHSSVVTSLRNCDLIKHLIYVACSPVSVIDNLNYLTLPTEQSKRGKKRTGE